MILFLKLSMSLEIFPHGGFGVIAHSPRAIAKYKELKRKLTAILPTRLSFIISFELVGSANRPYGDRP
jgi:hypothetical protein